jgi:hypothetical protein
MRNGDYAVDSNPMTRRRFAFIKALVIGRAYTLILPATPFHIYVAGFKDFDNTNHGEAIFVGIEWIMDSASPLLMDINQFFSLTIYRGLDIFFVIFVVLSSTR